ncbi:MAG: TnpV protein [Clostridia bacterium]|nr:TnpV protein [Clostridia bacterium]
MLKEHDPDKYTSLLFEGTLKEYLPAQDEYISERIWDLTLELAKKSGVNEDLKCRDQLRWVQEINSFGNTAEEIVLAEYFE